VKVSSRRKRISAQPVSFIVKKEELMGDKSPKDKEKRKKKQQEKKKGKTPAPSATVSTTVTKKA
jgi:hypothetical protein